MKVGFSCGYTEEFWAGWPWRKSYGGSEHMIVELAAAMADMGHQVTVRLPRRFEGNREGVLDWRGVRWIDQDHVRLGYERLFLFDDFARKDRGDRAILVACRSDPPRHTEFSEMVFLSKTHARMMGHEARPAIGGGVDPLRYAVDRPRIPRRVIYTSSPDRGGHHARIIGQPFDFVATYRGTNEVDRSELEYLQRTAKALIHPYDAPRESEFFGMAILEALMAGTPCVISDGPALVELWGDVAQVLPRPIRYSQWQMALEELMADPAKWAEMSTLARAHARAYSWRLQAGKFLEV